MIKVLSVDDVLKGTACTFIKMDIEGAEMEALKGSYNTIKKYHPKLAISIYHKPWDFIEIPMYINEIYSGYKFYMRQYTSSWVDTVLYAIPEV